MKHLQGRIIKVGRCRGQALVSPEPLSFFGGVDATTGIVVEPGHPLQGQSIAGRVLVFPTAKGSTVGSYILYRLKKAGLAPCGIVNTESEPIVAVGAIMAEIPMVDHIDIAQIQTGDWVAIDGANVTLSRLAHPR
jgi:predicted aconitase with swiveling domain